MAGRMKILKFSNFFEEGEEPPGLAPPESASVFDSGPSTHPLPMRMITHNGFIFQDAGYI